ncbi:MAG: hypothetical protein IPL59_05975 [Candidatus Competibacteraceae bacterium]|nr:hypothetical protein [Candidatus Competibacteraceae bacterium]
MDMMGKITLITNPMLPKSPLPNGLFPLPFPTPKHGGALRVGNLRGERPLDIGVCWVAGLP